MKKILFIFLIFVSVLGLFSFCIAESDHDYYNQINTELNILEANINIGDREYMYDTLNNIRTYCYDFAKYLALNNRYNERILDVSIFAAKAIELENVYYIEQARIALNDVLNGNFVIIEGNHS